MAFPQTPLPIKQELLIDGTWTDITSRTRLDGEVRISRGQGSEQAGTTASAGSATWTANNRDYFFSNRSPSSVNYGKLGRNTQYRASVTESTAYLKLPDNSDSVGSYDGAMVSTTDKAVLDITGDLDLRVDVQPDNWRSTRAHLLMCKYNTTGSQRSWIFYIDRYGYLRFGWSVSGTTTFTTASTTPVTGLGRKALRVTLDVNNGSGGLTVTFYTADTITGSWTQLGNQVVGTGGTTSIFSSSAVVMVGAIPNGASAVFGRAGFALGTILIDPFVGRIYRAQVYNGIGGTLVADMNPGSQSAGTTSWSDGLSTPNTWTLAASAEITAQNFRFWGEIGAMPQEWDTSGTDIFGQVQSYDLISRLLNGAKSLHSPIYRNLIRYASTSTGTDGTLSGYWPMENGASATRPTAAIGENGLMTSAVFGTDTDFPGSEGVLTFSGDDGYARAACVSNVSGTGDITFLFYFRAPSVPAAASPIMDFYMIGGNCYRASLGVTATTYTLDVVDTTGASLLSTAIGFGGGGEPNQPMAMRIQLVQNGANVDYAITWYAVGGPVFFGSSGSFAGTIGRPLQWISRRFTGKSGWWISHVTMMRELIDFSEFAFVGSTNAYTHERVENRFARLCREEGIPYWVVGWQNSAAGFDNGSGGEFMGPQTAQAFMDLVRECAALDRGMIYSPRDKFGLTFRMGNSLIGQEAVELDYSANHLSPGFKPRDDLFFVRNDVTVTNSGGGSARAVKTSGSLNVNEPADDPDGVGTYDPGPISREAYDDDRLTDLAQEEIYFGTWDELRYPQVPIELARKCFIDSPTLTASLSAVDIGNPIKISNLPAQLPPDDVELLVIGYQEVLRNRGRPLTFNTSPYGPYRSLNNLSGSDLFRARLAASNSTLTSSLTSSATSFQVSTPTGKLWRTGSSSPTFPMAVVIGGEEMSVGSISSTTSPQTFSSVTRSVNGVVKAHSAGDDVQVRDKFYLGR